MTPLEFRPDLWRQETKSPWAIIRHCLRDPAFSSSDTVPACDGQTDRQTQKKQHVPRYYGVVQ